MTASQPNDIADPWSTNSNGLLRLTVVSNASGTVLSGSVSTGATTAVNYEPNFAVAGFTNLLVAGSNTIHFVNHNGFSNAAINGAYSVTLAASEPNAGFFLIASITVVVLRRKR